ncbi:DUF397 domain-containing protein [Actinoalloteichus hymeniacidonis]|uniref:DUF397 family protein n=1 Tax=Actinoalloteichus hymeniacidonis TaxID=340345 RepID=A0AAC9HTW5_9PSEU|nr:DUF397 domain-containing protein [Actinoalloteichus hymeniacidonis]AOS65622.1 putative DUF397 family protein [Actinoalloteichus hymeniacidonis]MBB5906287.1 hypothetical protein [Actinoalloteichus hymeniacidonis]
MSERYRWRKSSRSGTQSACIEVGHGAGSIGIRDTKDRTGGTLVVDPETFAMFLTKSAGDEFHAQNR